MNYFTKDFFDFKGYVVQKVKKNETEILVSLVPRRKTAICSRCGARSGSVFAQGGQRKVKHSRYEGKVVVLLLPRRRFTCKSCNKPFSETPDFVKDRARSTNNFAVETVHALSRSSFRTVCETYQVSYNFLAQSLKNLSFDNPWSKGELILGFDEHAYGKRHMMITVCDITNHKLLAILPHYSKEAVAEYLDAHTEEERGRVVELCFDMRFKQQKTVESYFPGATTVIDKFHVLAYVASLIDADRRIVCTKFGCGKRENLRQVMRVPDFRLTEKEKEFLLKVFGEYPELKSEWDIYQKLARFYHSKSKDEGRMKLREIRASVLELDDSSYLKTFARTVKRLEEEILNYFDNKTTNAFTEGVHTKIKLIKRTSYGFRNIEIYIKKMMLGFLPFATISLLLLPH